MRKLILLTVELFICQYSLSQSPNYFYTYLVTGINSTDTTITFRSSDLTYVNGKTNFYATLFDDYYGDPDVAFKNNAAEIIYINSNTSNTFDVERGRWGTTARAFNTPGRQYKLIADVYNWGAAFDSIRTSGDTVLYFYHGGIRYRATP